MYESFYGLRERPFDLSPDLKYLLLVPKFREALSNLDFALSIANGLTLLIGEPGTGKTMLLRTAVAAHRARCVEVTGPSLTSQELARVLAHEFQLDDRAVGSRATLFAELEQVLLHRQQEGITSVLVVDQAPYLPDDLLEDVRRLAAIVSHGETLLRVVLAGDSTLVDRLNEPGLGRVKSGVGLRCVLPALVARETATYVAHRIAVAGGIPANVFTREAVTTIHEYSRGIPRTINIICDHALTTAFAIDQRPVDHEVIFEVTRYFEDTAESEPPSVCRDPLPMNGVPMPTYVSPVPGPENSAILDPRNR
jgi:general secretion pathway protein A